MSLEPLFNTLNHTNEPIIMGIINLTDDSFYDGGKSFDILDKQLTEFSDNNVAIIDIGAESTRPGAAPINADEEIKRLTLGLSTIKNKSKATISVDTYKPQTAEFALNNGAEIINDISGGESKEMLDIVAKHNAAIVIMHKQGSPQTMQKKPSYNNVVDEVKNYLSKQISLAKQAGINHVIVDPGIGFGKILEHNLAILKSLDTFIDLGCPLLLGTSNKSFIGQLTGAAVDCRIPGSIASVLSGYQKGAKIFRVHNVFETKQALDVFKAVS